MCIMMLQFFWHPYLSSIPAGAAQCLMYLAILAPLFWVSRLDLKERDFLWLVYLLWGFHVLSSIVGVLQVYYPEIFQFAISSNIEEGAFGGEHLKIVIANGLILYRPTGLTDLPGGAATSGFYALLLGTGIALQQGHLIFRLLGVISVPIGLFCIYLSQIRSIFILALVCLAVTALILLQLKRLWHLTAMIGAGILIAIATTTWAMSVGGSVTSERFLSLITEPPDAVLYQNRGIFLEETITKIIPQYPLGAGLARWGMMNNYFGNQLNPLTQPIWAEIQWTGWVLDGGIPLVIAYSGALIAACVAVWRIISDRRSSLQLWGAIILAHNIGAIAITFNYVPFMSQTGMDFWLINSALCVSAATHIKHGK
ncbi:hypothetical protein H6G63_12140 [Leptolyngbya sp. FACHB-402]|nr:hypothetical protein [Leptolyngbya sp. FACHB-161]MBD2374095.1 hypothetical protein [Leptolyngbya sp. FACHB-238]MBD2398720.1 hypothetical protein [Leptolyngbya sp. FACHB-239]MBD2404944.1 hypothetical protein [Leptolyngbya sp. FACHB-402]